MYIQTIQRAKSLRQIYLPQVDALTVHWSPHHAMSLNCRILGTAYHPLHEQSRRRWNTRNDPLWWNCLVSTRIGGTKRVVRGWLNNRVRVAFQNALKNKGYAENGARLVKDVGESAKGDLVGSTQFFVMPQLLHTSWEDLCNQTDLIVDALEKSQMQEGIQNRKERRRIIFGGGYQPKEVQPGCTYT